MKPRGLLIANPKATSTSAGMRDVITRALGHEVDLEVVTTTHRGHAELLASEAAAEEDGPLHNWLSERELQVFTRIARGVSPAVMANELGLSVKTVSTYRARILEKMGMRSNAEIAAYAVRNQLVD